MAAISQPRRSSATSAGSVVPPTIYDIEVDLKHDTVPLRALLPAKPGPVLIVNTASECGFTKQYSGLEALHQKYSERGLTVIGFPCNQFGHQEPDDDETIATSCQRNFGVSFVLAKKSDVNGPNTNRLFAHLKSEKGGGILGKSIKWNFTKFLIDKNGNVVHRFAPTTTPESIDKVIAKLL